MCNVIFIVWTTLTFIDVVSSAVWTTLTFIDGVSSTGPSFLNARLPTIKTDTDGRASDMFAGIRMRDGEVFDFWGYYQGGAPPYMWQFLPNCRECGGTRQSPVNIRSKDVIRTKNIPPFDFRDLRNTRHVKMTMLNDGRRVQVDYPFRRPQLKGGGLSGRFELRTLHFHWGKYNGRGTEHRINGRQYTMELHLEFYPVISSVWSDRSRATEVAVIAVLIDVGKYNNPKYSKIVELLRKTPDIGNRTELTTFPITDLFPYHTSCFYRYCGSLTTPPCTESVIWTIFPDIVYISQYQMNEFRKLKGKGNVFTNHRRRIEDTFRPSMSMNGRKVILTCPKYKCYGRKSRKFVNNGCINLSNRWNNIFISKRKKFIPRKFT